MSLAPSEPCALCSLVGSVLDEAARASRRASARAAEGGGDSGLRIPRSAGDSTFKYDLGSEDHEGNQDSTISVFSRDRDGTLRHFYSAHPWLAPDIKERGIDEYNPIWNILDPMPQGRGDFYASLDYGARVEAT